MNSLKQLHIITTTKNNYFDQYLHNSALITFRRKRNKIKEHIFYYKHYTKSISFKTFNKI